MPRTRFIEHQGVPILYLDFSRISEPATALEAIAEARTVVAQQAPESVRTLTDVTESHFDTTIVKALRELVEHNRPYVKAGAVVGLSGLMRVVYSTLVHLTGRNLRAFDDLEAAKTYLAAQP
jgi:HEAT repeat protein